MTLTGRRWEVAGIRTDHNSWSERSASRDVTDLVCGAPAGVGAVWQRPLGCGLGCPPAGVCIAKKCAYRACAVCLRALPLRHARGRGRGRRRRTPGRPGGGARGVRRDPEAIETDYPRRRVRNQFENQNVRSTATGAGRGAARRVVAAAARAGKGDPSRARCSAAPAAADGAVAAWSGRKHGTDAARAHGELQPKEEHEEERHSTNPIPHRNSHARVRVLYKLSSRWQVHAFL